MVRYTIFVPFALAVSCTAVAQEFSTFTSKAIIAIVQIRPNAERLSQFVRDDAEAFCDSVTASSRTFGLYRVFLDERAARIFNGQPHPHGYEQWKQRYEVERLVVPDLAEVMFMHGDCAVRARINGNEHTLVLRGNNPWVRRFEGGAYKIAHVAVRNQPQLKKEDPPSAIRLKFYITSDHPLDRRVGRGIAEDLLRKTAASHLHVVVRLDSWFMVDEDVPTVLPFGDSGQTPSYWQLTKAPEITCMYSGASLTCSAD